MVVGIDAHMIGDHSGGNESYYSNIIKNMTIPAGDRYILFVKKGTDMSSYSDKFSIVEFESEGAFKRNFIELPKLCKKYKLDVLHTQYFIPFNRPCPVVCTIHDICFEHYKDIFTKKEYIRQKLLIPYAAFVNQIVLMSFLLIIVKMEERTRSFLKDRYIILTLSIPIITIMVCAGVLSIDADNGNNIVYTSVVIIGLVAINIITIILLMMEQNICQKQAENAIQMEMLEHQKQNVDEINKVYLETKKVRHEITKVIDMTQYLIENGQQERAVNYLSEFQKEGKLYRQDNIYSENAIINHILNRKIEYCNNNGLSIKCMVCGELKGVSDYDIHIILENLLDNAIEAALKAVNKRISVDIYSDEQAMVIKISNTTEENVLKNNPEMNTTKKDNSYHGYGIKNVSELVKKNNGTIEYIQLGVDIVQCRVLLML